jgi:hypothetical protein
LSSRHLAIRLEARSIHPKHAREASEFVRPGSQAVLDHADSRVVDAGAFT